MIDIVPSFTIRVRRDPKTQKTVFAAEVESVFDIAWLTLARKIADDVPPEEKGKHQEIKGLLRSARSAETLLFRTATGRSPAGRSNVTGKGRKETNDGNGQRKDKPTQHRTRMQHIVTTIHPKTVEILLFLLST